MEDTSLNGQQKHNNHARMLEEIDREQRLMEEQTGSNEGQDTFSASIVEALNTQSNPPETPLMSQEELEDEDPPRVNWTAVICTLIVVVSAMIMLCVAKPWKNKNDKDNAPVVAAENTVSDNNNPQDNKVANTKQNASPEETPKAKEEKTKPTETKTEAKKPAKQTSSTLPVMTVTKTGTDNPYNNIRLIDASSRKLTSAEVQQMTTEELGLSRNAIYARHGYQFNHKQLGEFFSKQSWFKPTEIDRNSIPFTDIEVANINLIQKRERELQLGSGK